MFERSPECFDHRVRIGDVYLGQNPLEIDALELVIDISIHVFTPRIADEERPFDFACDLHRGLAQDSAGRPAPETALKRPGQDPPRVVVNDRVQKRTRSIK